MSTNEKEIPAAATQRPAAMGMGAHALWRAARARAEEALASGVLHSFDCALDVIEDHDTRFVIRRATRFPVGETAKGRGKDAKALPSNPFLDPEPALVVGDVGPAHRALLNKFSVLREHMLLVGRTFADQRLPLAPEDFAALGSCMSGPPVLAFFNGGPLAGASQTHKHIQMVTLPLAPHAAVPIEPLLGRDPARLPFRHAFGRLEEGEIADPARMHARYRELLQAAGVDDVDGMYTAYNMVLTTRWMLVVPRTRDRFEGISINALAYAGSFFVRDMEQQETIRAAGPVAVMRAVGRA